MRLTDLYLDAAQSDRLSKAGRKLIEKYASRFGENRQSSWYDLLSGSSLLVMSGDGNAIEKIVDGFTDMSPHGNSLIRSAQMRIMAVHHLGLHLYNSDSDRLDRLVEQLLRFTHTQDGELISALQNLLERVYPGVGLAQERRVTTEDYVHDLAIELSKIALIHFLGGNDLYSRQQVEDRVLAAASRYDKFVCR